MPKFRVERGHTIDVWVEVIVEAEDEDAAHDKLDDLIGNGIVAFLEGTDQDGHYIVVYPEDDDAKTGLLWGRIRTNYDPAEERIDWAEYTQGDEPHPFFEPLNG